MFILLTCMLCFASSERQPLIEVQDEACDTLTAQEDVVGLERLAALVSHKVIIELIELENRFEETHDFLQRNARGDPTYKPLIRYLRRKRLKVMRTVVQFDREKKTHIKRATRFEQYGDRPKRWVRRKCKHAVGRMVKHDEKRAKIGHIADRANELLNNATQSPQP